MNNLEDFKECWHTALGYFVVVSNERDKYKELAVERGKERDRLIDALSMCSDICENKSGELIDIEEIIKKALADLTKN